MFKMIQTIYVNVVLEQPITTKARYEEKIFLSFCDFVKNE